MITKETQSSRKMRGGYYTPSDLSDFLVRWVSHIRPKSILEPSCGDGVFFDSIKQHCKNPGVVSFEIDKNESSKARRRVSKLELSNTKIHSSDFLKWAIKAMNSEASKFDAIVGNPPFIRNQYLPDTLQDRTKDIYDKLGCKFTKNTNFWTPFVLAGFDLLRPGGRLAMIVPAEIIHVAHAQPLRSYLGQNAKRLVIIDPEELWFEDTLQGTVMLLVEKKSKKSDLAEGLGIYSVRGRSFLQENPETVFNAPQSINGKTVEGKWTRALLPVSTRNILDELVERGLTRTFKEVADVDIGIVTGANKFFHVGDEIVERFHLQKWAHPMFGRSEHCPGIIYDESQHRENATNGKPTNFIWLENADIKKTAGGRQYIAVGERERLHERHKCSSRAPWYAVPSVYAAAVGMPKRCHDAPRLILNKMNAFTTDSTYRIRLKEGRHDQFIYSFINGLTALSAELEGRYYGGGVLELIPSEVENLLLPVFADVMPKMCDLNKAVRSMPMQSVLESQTEIILGGLGVPASQREELLDKWLFLKNRRQRISPAENADEM